MRNPGLAVTKTDPKARRAGPKSKSRWIVPIAVPIDDCSLESRRPYREDGKVKHETLGNLSDLPPDVIEFIRKRLNGELEAGASGGPFEIVRSLPHGNVVAVLQSATRLGLDQLLCSRPCRERDLILALVTARIISPASKLSACAGLQTETSQSTLAEELELGEVAVGELYAAMDWLLARQTRIENKLAKKHLRDGTLVLFDVSSSYYTGRKSTLVRHGYSRDHRSDRPQIVYGLLCDMDGRPIHHHKDDRIRAHVFICMLAYYVEWHLRQQLREVLFDDCDRHTARESRRSVVAPAVRSDAAKQKDATRRTELGFPVQSFQDLLKDLATITRHRIRIAPYSVEIQKTTMPTDYQRHVLSLLQCTLERNQKGV